MESSDENVDAILRDVDKINLDRISQMSHEEIIQAQQEIMAMLPASFKNVMNNKNLSKKVPPQPKTEPLPALKSSQTGNTNLNPSPLERFDLSGCRVFADDKQAIVLLSTSITELLALSNIYIDSTTSLTTSNSLSPSKGATNDDALATALLDAATRAGFITICGDVEALSSVELFQHQYDPELPGYSMHEILEVGFALLPFFKLLTNMSDVYAVISLRLFQAAHSLVAHTYWYSSIQRAYCQPAQLQQ